MDKKVKGTCPICEASIEMEKNTLLGELITCGGCGGDLEVISVSEKIELKTAPEIQEDWGE